MANKPRIRFRGFTEDWEQRKLDELTISIGDGLHGTPKYDENGSYYFINGNNLVNSKVSVTEETKKVAFEALSNDDRRLDSTSILMSINGTIGTLARYNNESIMLGKSVAYITPKNINRDFLFYQLQGNVIQSYFYKNLTGTTIKNLGLGTIKNVIVMSTLSEEESKIGQFFYKLDQYITLHQCKLKKLNLAKKSLLQKLFPRNGSQIPGVRFKGFTDAWEQRKLCQITTRVTRKNGDQSDLPLTISAQDGLVDQRKYFNRQVASRDMSNYYLIKKGEFAYNKSYSEGYPFGAVKRLDYYDIGALSTLYILFEITDNNISSDFIVSYYMTHLWYKEISKRAAEGARNHGLLNISTEDFFDSELNIPNSIEEQVKIGNFIKQFDKFITLHQRKLERLQEVKKGLLQKMFV